MMEKTIKQFIKDLEDSPITYHIEARGNAYYCARDRVDKEYDAKVSAIMLYDY